MALVFLVGSSSRERDKDVEAGRVNASWLFEAS
jgi:hypothetical protein